MNDVEVLRRAAAWEAEGRRTALATVVSTWGSAPRPAGSPMAVAEGGAFEGSVSGGCIEGAVVLEAGKVLSDGRPRLLEYGVADDRAWSLGLACGGRVRVLVERTDPALLSRLLADVEAARPAVLATDLGTFGRRLLAPEPGVPADGDALLEAAREALRTDRTAVLEGPGGAVLLRPWNPPVRVVVVGAVHLAQPLARMALLAGYGVRVVDPRGAFATPERFPGVVLDVAWPDEALARARLDRRTALVALTHDPKIDDPALAAALRSEAFYVGALGSRRSHAARRERLSALGLDGAALDRIHGPVGLDIGAVSAAEIAVAILAELVAALRRR